MSLLNHLNNALKKEKFLPLVDLKQLLTKEAIRDHLTDQGLHVDAPTFELILSRPRLFAILILLKSEQEVVAILREFEDDTFFFCEKNQVPREISDQGDFFEYQAHFPPELTCNDPPKEFPAFFQPPFSDSKKGAHGTYGIVRRVRVADGHLPGHNSDESIAWKRIDQTHLHSYQILEEVKTLKNRCHKHIVPLLACYSTLAGSSIGPELHLLFPWADTDMYVWMTQKDVPRHGGQDLNDAKSRKDYLYDTILSLLSGLAYIHRSIDNKTSSHHDIKPDNILLFGNVWKISDFGSSRLKSLTEGSQTEREHLGSAPYQPPEYRKVKTHGRAFDIWSMGCVMVELAVLMVYGWENPEVGNFAEARAHNLVRPGSDSEGGDSSFVHNMPIVHRWINEMSREDGSRSFTYLMETVSKMLSVEPDARPYAWESELFLHAHFYPNEKGSDRRRMMKDLVQEPVLARHVESPDRHNPLACAIAENDTDLANCLREKGWRLNLPADNSGSNDGAGGVVSLVEGFKPSQSQIAELFVRQYAVAAHGASYEEDKVKSLANRFAERLSSANLTYAEIKNFLDRKHPYQPMSIVTGKLHVDHSDGQQHTALFWAAWSCEAVAVDILLRYGATLDPINHFKETPLIKASMLGHDTVVERLLREKGIKMDYRDRNQRTAISYAAQFGHTGVVRLLLSHGANYQTAGQAGRTPFSLAAQWGHIEIVKLLQEYKADPRTVDKQGFSPLTHAMSELRHRQWKGEEEDSLRNHHTIVEILSNLETVDDGAVREVLRQRNIEDPQRDGRESMLQEEGGITNRNS